MRTRTFEAFEGCGIQIQLANQLKTGALDVQNAVVRGAPEGAVSDVVHPYLSVNLFLSSDIVCVPFSMLQP